MHKKFTFLAAALLTLAACAAPPPPPDYAAQYQPLLDAYIAGWSEGTYDALDAGVTEDFKRRAPAGMNSDGPAGIKQVMADLRSGYPDAKVVLDESHYMKDMSFHLWTFTGTNTGPGATPPTGKPVELSGATVIRYRDGKMAEEHVYFDVLDWQMQLGYTLMPPAAAAQ